MSGSPPPAAVVLLSGGLDSTTCLAWARRQGFACHALAVDYGQRHRHELAAARAVAEVLGAASFRVVATDSGYPDCRPEFVRAFEQVANLGTRAGVEGRRFIVHTPLMSLDKAGIIRLGASLGVDYAITHSCYDPAPDGGACGRCDACVLRAKGFREAGLPDPTRYTIPTGA